MIIAVVAALGTVMIVTPVMAQNMTGGNMTGGNMTGKISSVAPPPILQDVLLMLKESKDVHHHKNRPIRMRNLMGTAMVMVMIALTGMEETVQMVMKMMTINEDFVNR